MRIKGEGRRELVVVRSESTERGEQEAP